MNADQIYFLDSSAMAKLYVAETGSPRMLEMVQHAKPGRICISRLAVVEVTSALVRRSRQGDFDQEALNAGLALVDEDVARFHVSELGSAITFRAVSLVRKHALRGADAIHLASVLIVRGDKATPGDVVLVSSDRELNAAAEQEQLLVIDPSDE